MAVKTNEILIGSKENPILALDNDRIISVNGNLACDLLCETIPVDTLEIQCRYDRMQVAFSPIDYDGMRTSAGKQVYARSAATEDVLNIPYASGLWYYNGGAYIGKFYVVDAQRTGKAVYTIKAQSAIGILDVMPYYGKLFVNTPLPDAINDIISTDGMRRTETPFLLDLAESIVLGSNLDTVTVTGWIPVCTKREALHHVLFAQGINILKSENDAFLVSRITNLNAGEIDPSVLKNMLLCGLPVPAGIQTRLAKFLDTMTDESQIDILSETGQKQEIDVGIGNKQLEALIIDKSR